MSRLLTETSPYLLQHARNPVDWHPWGQEALAKAALENKPLIISIGYSACHWCHVMEKESFMNNDIAELMNENFVCIKIDREERPDIDMIYMHAIQLIQGQGGWPLNVFALPDGSPFYGGTYFRKETWTSILLNVSRIYKETPEELISQAKAIRSGLKSENLFSAGNSNNTATNQQLTDCVRALARQFDSVEGGFSGAPKFPMPVNFLFLLRYYRFTNDESVLSFAETSLRKMAMGGIYDQIRGGFARYSTDNFWKVPHFEKMLYDNAQLISLYSEAWQLTKKDLYKNVVYECMNFVDAELRSPEKMFWSALDADSEGREGYFYTWKKDEIVSVLGDDADLFCFYYEVEAEGQWDDMRNILLRKQDLETLAKQNDFDLATISEVIENSKKRLLEVRNKRIHPGLDFKVLTSWNALMIKACFDAYKAFHEPLFLEMGQEALDALLKNMLSDGRHLFHRYAKGQAGIPAFLDDYALLISALLSHPCDQENYYLKLAGILTDETLRKFYDETSGMCWYTSSESEQLITRKMEITDNVIPASNSVMARALFSLGQVFNNEHYLEISNSMLQNVTNKLLQFPSSFSNWGTLLLENLFPYYIVAVVGPNYQEVLNELHSHYLPNTILIGSENDSNELDFLKNRFTNDKTMIHICTAKGCILPTDSIPEALQLLSEAD